MEFEVRPDDQGIDLMLNVKITNHTRKALTGEVPLAARSQSILRNRLGERGTFRGLQPGASQVLPFPLGYSVGDDFKPKPFKIWLSAGGWLGYWPSMVEGVGKE